MLHFEFFDRFSMLLVCLNPFQKGWTMLGLTRTKYLA